MRTARGFTLIELMVAGSISAVVVLSAFVALSGIQQASARQNEANLLVSNARLAIEVIARDIRAAGDSVDLLRDAAGTTPVHCLGGLQHPTVVSGCPAILEPHPWRLVIARNAWSDVLGGTSRQRLNDVPPLLTRQFNTEPQNVVMYEFVPYGTGARVPMTDGQGITRNGILGRIDRTVNPFGFGGSAKQTTVLLDNVLLDDRMRTNPDPTKPTETDARYDFALFMYQVLTERNEFQGTLSDRLTGLDDSFLTPPLRFFPASKPAAIKTTPPYMPDHAASIVGLEKGTTAYAWLRKTGNQGMKASVPASDLRMILDRNRIRAVRVAFKVVGPERADVTNGLDLDGNAADGSAVVYSFETTAEIKPLALFTGL